MGVNTKAWKKAEIPSANGHSNARALAKIYGILANGGVYKTKTLLSEKIMDSCSHEESYGLDAVLNIYSIGISTLYTIKSVSYQ